MSHAARMFVAAMFVAAMAMPGFAQRPGRPGPRPRREAAPAPQAGQPAPDVTLRKLDSDETVKLSQFRGKKPVLLIFGSYT